MSSGIVLLSGHRHTFSSPRNRFRSTFSPTIEKTLLRDDAHLSIPVCQEEATGKEFGGDSLGGFRVASELADLQHRAITALRSLQTRDVAQRLLATLVGLVLLSLTWGLLHSFDANRAWLASNFGRHRITPFLAATPNAPFSSPAYVEHKVFRPIMETTNKTSFRQNLIPGERYITSRSYEGFNNQFQSVIHLLYLALKTERVAVLPPLQPIHINPPSFARWDEFFDMEGLQKATGVAMIEWFDLKDTVLDNSAVQQEPIACWSSREASHNPPRPGKHRGAADWTFDLMGLQPVMWPLPMHIRGIESGYVPLSQLIAFDSDAGWKEQWVERLRTHGMPDKARMTPPAGSPAPDDQFLCFDDTFYLMQATHAQSPSYPHPIFGPQVPYGQLGIGEAELAGWRTVGQYMRWKPSVNAEVDRLLRYTMGLDASHKIPPYISVHIRRGDYGIARTVDGFAEKVEYIRQQLNEGQNSPVRGRAVKMPVICSTDDHNPEFTASITRQGWYILNHTGFQSIERHGLVGDERYGGWWPTILSSAVLSGSTGLVGSHWSTFSIYAWIRMLTWQSGAIGIEAD